MICGRGRGRRAARTKYKLALKFIHFYGVKSRFNPTRIATKDASNYHVVLEPQARSLTNREITQE